MGSIINGTEISKNVKERCSAQIASYTSKGMRAPNLSVLLIGSHPASVTYVNAKKKAAEAMSMVFHLYHLDEGTQETEVLALLAKLNKDASVDGVFVQMPLPKHLNSEFILSHIDPKKDVDGLHPTNLGLLVSNQSGFVACTPKGALHLIKTCNVSLSGKKAVVIGRSILVGKPMVFLLEQQNMTVTLCHSKTQNIAQECAQADVLVAAVGQPLLVKKEWVKEGAIVIDVGINRDENNKIVGDVDFADVADKAGFITPVPKGVGPMTIAMLLENTFEAYCRHMGVDNGCV